MGVSRRTRLRGMVDILIMVLAMEGADYPYNGFLRLVYVQGSKTACYTDQPVVLGSYMRRIKIFIPPQSNPTYF